MKSVKFLFCILISLVTLSSVNAQCPNSIKKLNARKIKYVIEGFGSEEPTSITYDFQDFELDRSGSSSNFFTENFLDHLPDHAATLTINYPSNSEDCVYDASGARSTTAPVEISIFTAKKSNKDVELHWITQMEQNNAEFEVQQSFDGEQFEPIAFIDGAGDSNSPIGYSFTDYNIKERTESETIYYRLQQHDFDGASSYSGIIAVELDIEKDQFAITKVSGWDSSNGTLNVFFNSSTNIKKVYGILANYSGRIYDQSTLYPEAGINNYEVNIQQFKSPIYIVSLNNGRTILSKKIALSAGY